MGICHCELFGAIYVQSEMQPAAEFSRRERMALWALSLYAFALRIPLAFRIPKELTGFPYGDDAYYVFSVARNVASGRGITIDGVHLTNGFQPLIALLYVPLFWVSHDPWVGIRLSFLLNGAIVAISVWAIARLMQRMEKIGRAPVSTPVIAAALWTFSMSVFLHMTNGLETGLYSLLLILSLAEYIKIKTDSPALGTISSGRWALLGVLLGLTVLARIDAAIFVAIVVVYEVAHCKDIRPLIAGVVAFIISLPWWIYNVLYFGSIMPTSGQAENMWPVEFAETLRRMLEAISDILLVVIYAPDSWSLFDRIALTVVLIVAIIVIAWKASLLDRLRQRYHTSILTPFAAFGAILIIYYGFFFAAPHFIPRFWQPVRILYLLVFAISIPLLTSTVGTQNRKAIQWTSWSLIVIALVFQINRYIRALNSNETEDYYEVAQWARTQKPQQIGMLQAGIASFIAPNVVNLDGKVNTEALQMHKERHLGAYIRDRGFLYLADWKPFVEDLATIARTEGNVQFDSVGRIGRFQIMKRKPAN